jgi:hypothetical protein
VDVGAAWHTAEEAGSLLVRELAMEMDALISLQCYPPGMSITESRCSVSCFSR